MRVPERPARTSAWEPLHHRIFRMMWISQFAANVGTWAQTVGAQWLMGNLGGGAFEVALVQTAATLPVFLLVVPSGAIGDILDRRRVLLVSNTILVAGNGLLALLTALDVITPSLLLASTAFTAVGIAIGMPTFAAIQPELVPRGLIREAALLNAANLNVARAVGPALGGVLISAVGPEATFALNAAAYVGVVWVIASWRRPPDDRPLGAEHVRGAIAAGLRYVRAAPTFATLLVRALLFIVFASALWALLPVVARGPLQLGASGYGLLLAALGLGAVTGAFVIPGLRERMNTNALVTGGTFLYAISLAIVAVSKSLGEVVPALAVAGFCWIAVMSSLSATSQLLLPNWTRARALAFFNLTFMGGQALGSVLWGALASTASLETALLAAAAGLVVGLVAGSWLALHPGGDVAHTQHWPDPHIVLDLDKDTGPILVTAEWRIDPKDADAFIEAMRPVGRSRRRTGAVMWGLFRDAEDPSLFLETFTVSTWQEHLRQHLERGTVMDQELETRARSFLIENEFPRVRHLVWALPPGRGGV